MRNKSIAVFGGLALLVLSAAMLALAAQSQDFSISVFPPAATVSANRPIATYTAVLSSQGFSGKVILDCKSDSPGASCTVSPSWVQLNRELSVSATVTAASAVAGRYHLTIAGTASSASNQKRTAVTLIAR